MSRMPIAHLVHEQVRKTPQAWNRPPCTVAQNPALRCMPRSIPSSAPHMHVSKHLDPTHSTEKSRRQRTVVMVVVAVLLVTLLLLLVVVLLVLILVVLVCVRTGGAHFNPAKRTALKW